MTTDDAAFYIGNIEIDRNAHGISVEQQQVKACGVCLRKHGPGNYRHELGQPDEPTNPSD